MKQALLFFILIGLGTQTFAQTTKPEIVTDRPDQTEAPSLVPTGGIQDAGLTFKITPVVQWDVSAGLGLNDIAPDSFISTGISFRLLKF